MLAVTATDSYVLMISLVSLLKHTQEKIHFTILLITRSKKVNCSKVIKKHFNKELVMAKEDNEDLKNSNKFWVCDNDYVENDVKIRDYCHITGRDYCHIILN